MVTLSNFGPTPASCLLHSDIYGKFVLASWIKFTIFWTVGCAVARSDMRPGILYRRRGQYEKPWWIQYGNPTWTKDSTNQANEHYKAHIPIGVALWMVIFLMAVHLKNKFVQKCAPGVSILEKMKE